MADGVVGVKQSDTPDKFIDNEELTVGAITVERQRVVAYGPNGGSVSVSQDSGESEYTHAIATVTATGDTTIATPAAGKAIRLHWIYAINDPTSSTAPLIKVKLGTAEIFRLWAISKRQRKTGAVDAALIINLSATGNVAVTAIYEEV